MHRSGTKYAGTFRASAAQLSNVGLLSDCMAALIAAIDMTALGTHIYDVPKTLKRMGHAVDHDEGGLTAVVVLSTSHAAIHTWPEIEGARFDVDSCRVFDPAVVDSVLALRLGATDIRGTDVSFVFGQDSAPMLGVRVETTE